MLINFVDATNDANHYTKPPPNSNNIVTAIAANSIATTVAVTAALNGYNHRRHKY